MLEETNNTAYNIFSNNYIYCSKICLYTWYQGSYYLKQNYEIWLNSKTNKNITMRRKINAIYLERKKTSQFLNVWSNDGAVFWDDKVPTLNIQSKSSEVSWIHWHKPCSKSQSYGDGTGEIEKSGGTLHSKVIAHTE